MDYKSESCINFQDKVPEGELKTLIRDPSHVTLRQASSSVPESERAGFPFNRRADPLALQPVYRYARKIKHFLGWEDIAEDSEEDREDCSLQNSPTGESHSSDNEAQEEETVSQLLKCEEKNNREENKNIDERCAEDPCVANSQRNSSYLNVEDFSDCDLRNESEISAESKPNSKQDGDLTINKEEDTGNNCQPEIFRSEFSIDVGDFRNTEIVLSTVESEKNTELDSIVSVDGTDMDESLIERNISSDAGVLLNDADAILKDECEVAPSSGTELKCSGEVYTKEFIVESVNENNNFENHDKISNEKLDCANNSEGNNSFNVNFFTDEKGATLSDEIPADEKLDNKTEPNENGRGTVEERHETQKSDLIQNKKSLGALQEVAPAENGKPAVNHATKENQANNVAKPKVNNYLKAHIQYENDKNKEPATKNVKSGEKQGLDRKGNIVPDEDTVCGLGFFRPRWLQPCATAKVYVILYSIIGILHGSYYSYLIGTLSTLEKRFAFKSKTSGAIMIADEITPLLLGMIIGYYAGKAHRPRMVGLGMLLSAGCCFCSSLPYFIYGPVQHLTLQNVQNHISTEYCDPGVGTESCDSADRPQTLPAVLFLVFGSFLKGFGNLAYYAIGLAYLDDNSDKKSTPIYLAIALALRLLGPLVGFLMSSGFLKLYENPVDDPGFGPDDPRWIGAWWIGFFLQGVLLMIFTLPIALFPRRLPDQKTMEKSTSPAKEDSLKEIFAGLLSALKRLGLNPVFIVMIINTTMKIFGHFGHAIMLPKYMENQFRLSASEASLFSGATTIACIMISTVLGGFLIWKFRPTIKVLLAGMITSEVILCAGFLILMIPRCHTTDMLNFGMSDEGLILNSACNQNCDCSTTSFTPFCGPDGKTTYFSPCYAGCTQELISSTLSKKSKEFGNCSCVAAATAQPQVVASISEGFCPDENCWSQTLAYLIILFFLVTTSNLFTVAHTMILLRSVHPNDKSVALGTFETFICLFGFIPFPVTFGALVDSACLVWEKSCGETGNCWFYDMEKYAYLLHGASALFCAFSVVCLLTLYFLSSRVRNLYTDEEDDADFTDIKLDTVSGSVTKL